MNDPPGSEVETLPIPRSEGPGGRIGPFKILQQIGEGGFGSVYEAEQEQPVRRRVALKIIKLGMDTREVIARFEAEGQALAMMDHPHIARVLDAGATDSGRPYFVMELVKGEPISSYCSKHALSIIQRLQLFDQVCAAVQHAHTKGIIHRDLKPNNVLVSTQDDQPFAKVIDFGIAKATSGRLTEKTMYTEANLMMGTPLYMSPEQAEGSTDIDTRTDIYSLGVILYELLTDTTPIDSNTLRTAGYAEIQRIIREVEPPRPSARLSRSAMTKLGAEARDRVHSRKLTRMVRGELDWIAMKAIEKDRARRYETANALAMDVRRYIAGEAVLAAPPSASYRLRKFVRRHKGTVAAGSLIAICLVVGIAGFAWQAHIAKARADELEQVSKFQEAMLGQVEPAQAGRLLSNDVLAKFAAALVKDGVPEAERATQAASFRTRWQRVNATDTASDLIDGTILKPAVAAIDKQFKDQPVVDATLRQALADRYVAMGLYDAAMPLQRSALATRRRVLGNDHPDTLTSISGMGSVLVGQGKLDEAGVYFSEALAKSRRVLGENDPKIVRSITDVSDLLKLQHKFVEAMPYAREALQKSRRLVGKDSRETIEPINNMGVLLQSQGKFSEGEPYFREALEKSRRALGEEHQDTIVLINNMGVALMRQGKLSEAEPYMREALETSRRVQGEEHPDTLISVNQLGALLVTERRFAEAAQLLAPAEAPTRRVLTDDNAHWLASMLLHLGQARTGLGEFAAAEPNLLEAQPIAVKIFGTKDVRTHKCTQALIDLYTSWNTAEPDKGYDIKAAEWKRRLDALNGPSAEKTTH